MAVQTQEVNVAWRLAEVREWGGIISLQFRKLLSIDNCFVIEGKLKKFYIKKEKKW